MAIAGARVSIPRIDRRTLIGAGLAAVAALLVLLLTRPIAHGFRTRGGRRHSCRPAP